MYYRIDSGHFGEKNTPCNKLIQERGLGLLLKVDLFFSIFPGEWISGATCMYVANYLVTKYDRDALVSLERGYSWPPSPFCVVLIGQLHIVLP